MYNVKKLNTDEPMHRKKPHLHNQNEETLFDTDIFLNLSPSPVFGVSSFRTSSEFDKNETNPLITDTLGNRSQHGIVDLTQDDEGDTSIGEKEYDDCEMLLDLPDDLAKEMSFENSLYLAALLQAQENSNLSDEQNPNTSEVIADVTTHDIHYGISNLIYYCNNDVANPIAIIPLKNIPQKQIKRVCTQIKKELNNCHLDHHIAFITIKDAIVLMIKNPLPFNHTLSIYMSLMGFNIELRDSFTEETTKIILQEVTTEAFKIKNNSKRHYITYLLQYITYTFITNDTITFNSKLLSNESLQKILTYRIAHFSKQDLSYLKSINLASPANNQLSWTINSSFSGMLKKHFTGRLKEYLNLLGIKEMPKKLPTHSNSQEFENSDEQVEPNLSPVAINIEDAYAIDFCRQENHQTEEISAPLKPQPHKRKVDVSPSPNKKTPVKHRKTSNSHTEDNLSPTVTYVDPESSNDQIDGPEKETENSNLVITIRDHELLKFGFAHHHIESLQNHINERYIAEALIKHFHRLNSLGFTLEQIFSLANHDKGVENINTIIECTVNKVITHIKHQNVVDLLVDADEVGRNEIKRHPKRYFHDSENSDNLVLDSRPLTNKQWSPALFNQVGSSPALESQPKEKLQIEFLLN